MDIQTLAKILDASSGLLTISSNLFPNDAEFAEWVEMYFSPPFFIGGTGAIVISKASNGPQGKNTVVVNGMTNYANVAMPLSIAFTLVGMGDEQKMEVTAKLSVPIDRWSFPISFTDLPRTEDFTSAVIDAPFVSQLSTLLFTEAYFYVSNTAIKDEVWELALPIGQSFVGALNTADGSLGFYEWLLEADEKIVLAGGILHDKYIGKVPVLPLGIYPWDVDYPIPGILLEARKVSSKGIGTWKLSNAVFHVYSPIDSIWWNQNRSYMPQLAFAATIPFENPANPNPASVTVTSEVLPGINELVLSAAFTNVTIQKIDDLLHLIGKNDITQAGDFPPELATAIQHMENVLKEIAIKEAAVNIDFVAKVPRLNYFFVTIAIANPVKKGNKTPRKPIWEPVKGIAVEEVDMTVIVMDPFGDDRSVSMTLIGEISIAGVPVVFETDFPDFFIQGQLGAKQVINFNEFVQHYVPVTYSIPSVTIDTLFFQTVPGKFYVISTTIDQQTSWDFHVGTKVLGISNIALTVAYDAQQGADSKLSGSFSGTLEFAGNTLTMQLEAPGPLDVQIELPEVNLTKVIDAIADHSLNFIHGFDLKLENSLISLQEDKGNISFSLTTSFSGFADLAFSVIHDSKGNGFAFGINMSSSDLKKISKNWTFVEGLMGIFSIEDIGFVFSTVEDPGFTFPEVIDYTNRAKKPGKIRTSSNFSLTKGLTLFGEVDFSSPTIQHQPAKLLANAGLNRFKATLDFTVQLDYANDTVKAFLAVPQFTLGNPKNLVTLQGALGVIGGSEGIEFMLTGDLTATIDKKEIKASAVVEFDPDGFIISGDYKGTFALGHVQFSNLGLAIGVDDAGIPSFGFTTEIDSPNFDSSIALFIDSDIPTNSFFVGTISNITLYDVLGEIVGADIRLIPFASVLKTISLSGPVPPFALDAKIDVGTALAKGDIATLSKAFPAEHAIPSDKHQVFLVTNKKGERWTLTNLSSTEKFHYEILKTTNGFTASLEAEVYVVPVGGTFGDPSGSNGITFSPGIYVGASINFLDFHAQIQGTFDPGVGLAFEADCTAIHLFKFLGHYFFSLTDAEGKKGPSVSLATYTQKDQNGKILQRPHFEFSGKIVLADISASAKINAEDGHLSFDVKSVVGLNHFNIWGTYTHRSDFKVTVSSYLKIPIVSTVSVTISMDFHSDELDIDFKGWFTFITLKKNYIHGDLEISLKFFENLPKLIEKIILKVLNPFKQAQKLPSFMNPRDLMATETYARLNASMNPDTATLLDIYRAHAEEIGKLVRAHGGAADRVAVMMLEEEEYVFHVDLILEIIDLMEDSASADLAPALAKAYDILRKYRGKRFEDLM